jgi:putative membrane protein insertion efficiency factor
MAHDPLSHAVRQSWRLALGLPQRALLALVLLYRWTLKPWLGNACRFEPSCSQYALDALRRHGAVVGASLSTWRLLRCHPWCEGGCDPVPHDTPRLFSHLGLRPLNDTAVDAVGAFVDHTMADGSAQQPEPSRPPASPTALEPKPLVAGPRTAGTVSPHSPTIKPLS